MVINGTVRYFKTLHSFSGATKVCVHFLSYIGYLLCRAYLPRLSCYYQLSKTRCNVTKLYRVTLRIYTANVNNLAYPTLPRIAILCMCECVYQFLLCSFPTRRGCNDCDQLLLRHSSETRGDDGDGVLLMTTCALMLRVPIDRCTKMHRYMKSS